ncbi:rhomboid family intramembrane serine protease [Rhodococcus kronopolitis]|uniref:Rhomboid family intramembrane serine protease n=1 Tax=Rhodococcus kronopolitis TaxID=1460226 RepID=A0ABV9FMM6_9NOCA
MTNPMEQFGTASGRPPGSGRPGVPATTERPPWQQAAMVVGGFVVGLYLLEFIDMLLRGRLDNGGVEPRTLDGLWGIVFAPVLHAGWGHLVANTIPLLVLGFLVMLSGIGRGLAATGIIWVVGGLGQWLFGSTYSVHLGASVLVFGWLAYLIARGFFTRSFAQLALGVVVLIVYGGLLWGVFPGTSGMSWQGHLFGAVGGVLAAWVLASDVRKARAARAVTS